MRSGLRPRRADDLGLRRALSDRLLPLLVAAMIFLAALALAGAIAASGLADHWRGGAASLVTIQVPQPDAPSPTNISRGEAVAAALRPASGIASAHRLTSAEFSAILRPWLGSDATPFSLALPAVFEVRLSRPDDALAQSGLDKDLAAAAPGTLVERNGLWFGRLAALAASLRACAALALLVVAGVAAAVVAVATRAGLASRRDAIEIVHGLGATDGMIAGRFAARITWLTFAGGVLGLVLAVPVLLGLASLTAPFQTEQAVGTPAGVLTALPRALWVVLPTLPLLAALIGWLTAQATVRSWLGRLP